VKKGKKKRKTSLIGRRKKKINVIVKRLEKDTHREGERNQKRISNWRKRFGRKNHWPRLFKTKLKPNGHRTWGKKKKPRAVYGKKWRSQIGGETSKKENQKGK